MHKHKGSLSQIDTYHVNYGTVDMWIITGHTVFHLPFPSL